MPDALGRPMQAGAYATGVRYHPNGAIAQFTYGNGIVHTLTQNARQLPDTSQDAYGGMAFLSDYNLPVRRGEPADRHGARRDGGGVGLRRAG